MAGQLNVSYFQCIQKPVRIRPYFLGASCSISKLLNSTHNCLLISFPGCSNSKKRDFLIKSDPSQNDPNFVKTAYQQGSGQLLSSFCLEELEKQRNDHILNHITHRGRLYQIEKKSILDSKFTTYQRRGSDLDVFGEPQEVLVTDYRKQALFNRMVPKINSDSITSTHEKFASWDALEPEKTYPLYLDVPENCNFWSADQFYMVSRQKSLEKDQLILFSSRNRKRIFSLNRVFICTAELWDSNSPLVVNEVRLGNFCGAYKFWEDSSLTGKKIVWLKNESQDDDEEPSDNSFEFIRVFNYKTRKIYPLRLSRSWFFEKGAFFEGA